MKNKFTFNRIIQQSIIFWCVSFFLFFSAILTNIKEVSSASTIATLTPGASLSPNQAYPPPIESSPNESIHSAYPAPLLNPTQEPTKIAQSTVPVDRIVGITSDGQISDFTQNLGPLYGNVITINGSKYVLQKIPERQNGPAPMRIIGSDDRFQIQDTTYFPWDAVVRIEGKFAANRSFYCTGWMLGPSTVVTAGHCVYDYEGIKTYAYDVKITPGYNSAAMNPAPFGSCIALQGIVMPPWIASGDIGYDYGVFKLGCRIGIQTGNLGYKTIIGNGVGTSTLLTGYPVDKGGTTMWAGLGSITSSDSNSFYYDNDEMGGQSGGPVWDVLDPNCLCVVAVNANAFDPPTMNQGARINDIAFNFLLSSQQFIASQVFLPIIQNQ